MRVYFNPLPEGLWVIPGAIYPVLEFAELMEVESRLVTSLEAPWKESLDISLPANHPEPDPACRPGAGIQLVFETRVGDTGNWPVSGRTHASEFRAAVSSYRTCACRASGYIPTQRARVTERSFPR